MSATVMTNGKTAGKGRMVAACVAVLVALLGALALAQAGSPPTVTTTGDAGRMFTPQGGDVAGTPATTADQTFTYNVTKQWNEVAYDDETGKTSVVSENITWPAGATVTVTAKARGGTATYDLTLSEAMQSGTLTLPYSEQGYEFAEDVRNIPNSSGFSDAGYSMSVAENTVSLVNSVTRNSTAGTSIHVSKVWQDKDGNALADDANLPESVTVDLYQGEGKVDSLTLSKGSGYTGYFTNLDQTASYTVREDDPPVGFYLASVVMDGDEAVVTNRALGAATTSITVNKTWKEDGADIAWPQGATATVNVKNGDTVVRTASLNEDTQSVIFNDLPIVDAQGKSVSYTIEEPTASVPATTGYVWTGYATQDGEDGTVCTLTNTVAKITDTTFTVKKAWKDENGNALASDDANLPESVDVQVMMTRDGGKSKAQDLTLEKAKGYTATFTPTIGGAQYSIEESNPPTGYFLQDVTTDGAVITLTNQKEATSPETQSITVEKKWQDATGASIDWPEGATVTAQVKLGDTVLDSHELTKDEPSFTFEDIAAGVAPAVVESAVSVPVETGYRATTHETQVADGTVTFVNRLEPIPSAQVTKVWKDQDGNVIADTQEMPEVTINLYRGPAGTTDTNNMVDTGQTIAVNASNGFTGSFDNLASGYAYSVRESIVPDGYRLEGITGSVNGGFTVTNQASTQTVVAKKAWKERIGRWEGPIDWPDGATSTVQLRKTVNEQTTDIEGATATLDSANQEKTWDNLPTTENGSPVTYQVVETSCDTPATCGYEFVASETETATNGAVTTTTVTNIVQALRSVYVEGQWWDQFGDQIESPEDLALMPSVTAVLVIDGQESDRTVELNAQNNFTAQFDGLSQNHTYTVKEASVPAGFINESSYGEGTPYDPVKVINTEKPKVRDVTVSKVWHVDGGNDYPEGTWPEGVAVAIKVSGDAYKRTDTLTSDHQSVTFTGLPMYDSTGRKIDYSVSEQGVTGLDEAGLRLINSTTSHDPDDDIKLIVTNTVEPAPATTTITAKKVLEGLTLKDSQFTFDLMDGDTVIGTATNKPDGTITFDNVVCEPGDDAYDRTLSIVERIPANAVEKDGGKAAGGILYDTSTKDVTVHVGRNLDTGVLDLTVQGDGDEATFTNKVETASIKVRKMWRSNGGSITRPENATITCTLYADGMAMPGTTATIATDTYAWDGMPVLHADGTPIAYTVKEDAVYLGQDGRLRMSEDPIITTQGDTTTIINTVENTPVEVDLKASKVFEGEDLEDGQFTFTVTPIDRAYEQVPRPERLTATNAADGTIDFGKISFESSGTYTYEIREVPGSDEGIAYDATVKTVTFKLSYGDDTAYLNLDSIEGADPVFTNRKQCALSIRKTDSRTQTDLSGAALALKKDGSVVESWTSDGSAHTVTVPDGDYVLTEQTTPTGYYHADDIAITVSDGQVTSPALVEGSIVMADDRTNAFATHRADKVWLDQNGNELQDFPGDAYVQLYADGVAVAGKQATLSSEYKYVYFNTLPAYTYDGSNPAHKIRYSVQETGSSATDEYTTTVVDGDSLSTVTNRLSSQQSARVTVTKVWQDAQGSAIDWPADVPSVDVTLVDASGTALPGGTMTLTSDRSSHTFEVNSTDGLSVTEDAIPGYSSKVTGDAADGFIITNTRSSFTVKVVDGTDNAAIPGAVMLCETNNSGAAREPVDTWTTDGTDHAISSLPDGDYRIRQTNDIDGYGRPTHIKFSVVDGVVTSEGVVDGVATMKCNRSDYPETYSAAKSWKRAGEGGALDTAWPEGATVTVELLADGAPTGNTVELTEENPQASFADVPTYEYLGGGKAREIEYSVIEASVTGVDDSYTTTVTNDRWWRFDIVNTIPTKEIRVSKVWALPPDDEGRLGRMDWPSGTTVQMDVVGSDESRLSLEFDSEDNYSSELALPAVDAGGEEITYSIEEAQVTGLEGFTLASATNFVSDDHWQVVNVVTPNPVVENITAKKVVADGDAAAGEFSFTLSGSQGAPMPVRATATNDADGTIDFGPVSFDTPGTYTYTIKENKGADPDVYYDDSEKVITVVVTQGSTDNPYSPGTGLLSAEVKGADTAVFTNTHAGTITFRTVDATDDHDIAGAHMQLKTPMGDVVEEWDTLGAGHAIKDLPDGDYVLSETVTPDGYQPAGDKEIKVAGQQVYGAHIVAMSNERVDGTVTVGVQKKWVHANGSQNWPDGKTATVRLMQTVDGATTNAVDSQGNPVKLDLTGKKQQGAFEDLPTYDYSGAQAKPITYSVSESFAGYQAAVTGSVEAGFVITNTQEKTSVTLKKTWERLSDDAAVGQTFPGWIDVGWPEGATATFELYAGSVDTGIACTFDSEHHERTVDNLPVYDDAGEPIAYRAVETSHYLPDDSGYTYIIGVTEAAAEDGELACANLLNPKPVSVDLTAKKVLEGAALEEGQFSFIVQGESDVLPAPLEAVNDANGTVSFGAVALDKPGTYKYQVSEIQNADESVAFDGSVKTITVDVVQDPDTGKLSASVSGGGDEATFTNKMKPTTSLVVKKVDTQGNSVAGAKMQLLRGDNVIDAWTSDGTDHIVNGLYEGTYTIHEVQAPTGLEAADDMTVVVDAQGNITSGADDGVATVVDKPSDETIHITVTKEWADANGSQIDWPNDVSSVQAQIASDSDREYARDIELTAANATYECDVFKYDVSGRKITYTVTETNTPSGFVANTSYNEDDSGIAATITNTSTDGSRTVSAEKQWIDSSGSSVDWPSGKTVAVTLQTTDGVSVSGPVTLTQANPHYTFVVPDDATRYVVEEEAPAEGAGYWCFDCRGEDDGDDSVSFTLVNQIDPDPAALVSKVDSAGAQLAGAHMQVTKKGETAVEAEWDTALTPYSLHVPDGTYVLTETTAPRGYAIANPIEFTVTDGKADPYSITMVDARSTVDVSVSKVWREKTNQSVDVPWPEGATVKMTLNGSIPNEDDGYDLVVTKEIELDGTEDTPGTATIENMPEYVGDDKISYQWEEGAVSLPDDSPYRFVEAQSGGTADAGGTIVNLIEKKPTITVANRWLDNGTQITDASDLAKLPSIAVSLYRRDTISSEFKDTGEDALLTNAGPDGVVGTADDWTATFTVDDTVVSGSYRDLYEIRADKDPDGFKSQAATSGNHFVMTNVHATVYLQGSSTWKLVDSSGAVVDEYLDWPKSSSGELVPFTYAATDNAGAIVYAYGSVTDRLGGSLVNEDGSVVATQQVPDPQYQSVVQWRGLDANQNGMPANYDLFASIPDLSDTPYEFVGTEKTGGRFDSAGNHAYTFTFYVREKATLTVQKKWLDERGSEIYPYIAQDYDPVSIELYANGAATGQTAEIMPNGMDGWYDAGGDDWSYQFTGLDTSKTYTVKETVPEGFSQVGMTRDGSTITITNQKKADPVSVSVEKKWLVDWAELDDEWADGLSAEVMLMRNGTVIDTQVLDASQHAYSWTNLPRYDSFGSEYQYEVREGEVTCPEGLLVDDRDPYISKGWDGTWTITNYLVEEYKPSVRKIWEDYDGSIIDGQDESLPQSVTVRLYADDVDTGKTLTLDANGPDGQPGGGDDWTGRFEAVPKNDEDGLRIRYTVQEDAGCEGYASEVNREEYDFDLGIINRRVLTTTDVVATKTWRNEYGTPIGWPDDATVGVQLYVNGAAVDGTTATLDSVHQSITWEDMPKFDDAGDPIAYTALETSVDLPAKYVEADRSYDSATSMDKVSIKLINDIREIDLRDIVITKKWAGSYDWMAPDDADIPESVDVDLYRDGAYYDTATLSRPDDSSQDWRATFADMPVEGHVYTVREPDVPSGYQLKSITGDVSRGFTVLNKRDIASVVVIKQWVDESGAVIGWPTDATVTVQLMQTANGITTPVIGYSETLTSQTSRWIWGGLPRIDDEGNSITYSVEETAVSLPSETGKELAGETVANKGKTSITDQDNTTYVVSNVVRDRATVKVEKKFVDTDGTTQATNGLPESVTVALYADGVETDKTVELNAANGWKGAFENLPTAATYSVVETDVPAGFSFMSSTKSDDTVTITNRKEPVPETATQVKVAKEWVDDKGDPIDWPDGATVTVDLMAQGDPVMRDGQAVSATLTKDSPSVTWSDLPKYDTQGAAITYTVAEGAVVLPVDSGKELAGQAHSVVTDDDGMTATITNKVRDLAALSVTKAWVDVDGSTPLADGLPESVTVNLYANGALADSATLDAQGGWTHTFEGLARDVSYSVEEASVPDGFALASVSGTSADGYTIVNRKVDVPPAPPATKTVTVEKTWDMVDENGSVTEANITWPEDASVVAKLVANGVETGQSVTLTSDAPSHTWTDLPAADGNGDAITYKVVEGDVTLPDDRAMALAGYAYRFDASGTKAVLTNGIREIVNIPVEKKWLDDQGNPLATGLPASVTVSLYSAPVGTTDDAAFENAGRQVVLNAEGSWTGAFTGLPADREYRVREDVAPAGFACEGVTGSADDGFTVTNKKNPPEKVSVTVSKTWDKVDANGVTVEQGIAWPAGATVEAKLLKNGSEYLKQTLTADQPGCAWADLPKYDASGARIAYAVVEGAVALSDGAGVELAGSASASSADDAGNLAASLTNKVRDKSQPEPPAATVTVKAQKSWAKDAADGGGAAAWPEGAIVEVKLLKNGAEVPESQRTLTSDAPEAAWEGLPGEADGAAVSYSVVEGDVSIPADAGVEQTGSASSHATSDGVTTYAFTNTVKKTPEPEPPAPKTVRVSATKTWNKVDDAGAIEAASIAWPTGATVTVEVLANGAAVTDDSGDALTMTLTALQPSFAVTGLPAQDDNGASIAYTLRETATLPAESTVELAGSSANNSIDADGNVTYAFTNSVRDKQVEPQPPATKTVTVVKSWQDADGAAVAWDDVATAEVKLVAGAVVQDTQVLEGSVTSYTWADLPATDETGAAIAYGVQEGAAAAPADYTQTGSASTTSTDAAGNATVTLTNKVKKNEPPAPRTVDVPVAKTWVDTDGTTRLTDGLPASVMVTLMCDGAPTDQKLTLDAAHNWAGVFKGLEADHTYGVVEEVPDGFINTAVDADGQDGFVIVNQKKEPQPPATIDINVTKAWVDDAGQTLTKNLPAEVTVNLYSVPAGTTDDAAFERENRSLTLTAAMNWTGAFTGLPADREYRVREDVVPKGFSCEGVTGSADDGFTVTNRKNPPEKVTVTATKTWDKVDANGATAEQGVAWPEGATVEAKLLKNGAEYLKQTLTADQPGCAWGDLPKYDASGARIAYAVVEGAVALPDGAGVELAGSASASSADESGNLAATLTNKVRDKSQPEPPAAMVTVKAQKSWAKDAADGGGAAAWPEGATVEVKLLKNGAEVPESQRTLTSDAPEAAWEGLPGEEGGDAVSYSVVEGDVSIPADAGVEQTGSASSHATSDGVTTYAFTNTVKKTPEPEPPAPKTVTVTAAMTWDKVDETGKVIAENIDWPAGATMPVTLQRTIGGATEDVATVTLDAAAQSTAWNDLPVADSDGNAITYAIKRGVPVLPDGSDLELAGVNGGATTDEDGNVTGAYTAKVRDKRVEPQPAATVNVVVSKSWAKQTGEIIDGVPVVKPCAWPDGATVSATLQKTVGGTTSDVDTIVLSAGQVSFTWSDLPVAEGDQRITYSVVEGDVLMPEDAAVAFVTAASKSTVAVDGSVSCVMANTVKDKPAPEPPAPETVTVATGKAWMMGASAIAWPDGATVEATLKADGAEVETVTLSKGAPAKEWTDLDRYRADGTTAISYEVVEGDVTLPDTLLMEGKSADTATDEDGNVVVTLTNKVKQAPEPEPPAPEKVTVAVQKVWQDADGNPIPAADESLPATVTVKLLSDGQPTDKTLTLQKAAGYAGEFAGLEAGHTYSVEEDPVPDGFDLASTQGSLTEGFTIVNQKKAEPEPEPPAPETVTVATGKAWMMGASAIAWPDGATVEATLKADGAKVETVTLSKGAPAKEWTDLDRYRADGTTAISYEVVEGDVTLPDSLVMDGESADSATDEDGNVIVTLTNKVKQAPEPEPPTPEKVTVEVQKSWQMGTGSSAIAWPDGATVKATLVADGQTVETVTLTKDAPVKEWTGLDRYRADGTTPIAYEVVEGDVVLPDTLLMEGKSADTATDEDGNVIVTLTNTVKQAPEPEPPAPQTISVTAGKAWMMGTSSIPWPDDAAVQATLKADGQTVETVTLSKGAPAKEWTGLDKYRADGITPITYEVEEGDVVLPDDLLMDDRSTDSATDEDGNVTFTLTNKVKQTPEPEPPASEKVTVAVQKAWQMGADDSAILWPDGATVKATLKADGRDVETVTLSKGATTKEWTGLDKYRADGTTAIAYEVVEGDVSLPDTLQMDERASSTDIDEAGNVVVSLTNKVKQTPEPEPPTPEVEKVNAHVRAWWKSGGADIAWPEGATVTAVLKADGVQVGEAVTLDKDHPSYDWTDLDKYRSESVQQHQVAALAADLNKTPIVYTVEETAVVVPDSLQVVSHDHDSAVDDKGDVSATLVHSIREVPTPPAPETVSFKVAKSWQDADGNPIPAIDESLPPVVTVKLLADGQVTGQVLTLQKAAGYVGEFAGLEAGHTYSVEEDPVPDGFELMDTLGSVTEGFTIVNQKKAEPEPEPPAPETVDVPVAKKWVDSDGVTELASGMPSAVTVHLVSDGVETEAYVVLTQGNAYSAVFTGLESGHVYTVREDVPIGYTQVSIESDGQGGYVIVNKKDEEPAPQPKPEAATPVKVDVRDAKTGESIKGATVEVVDEHGVVFARWLSDGSPYTLELPEGTFTIKVASVPDGYTAPVDLQISVKDGKVSGDGIENGTIVMPVAEKGGEPIEPTPDPKDGAKDDAKDSAKTDTKADTKTGSKSGSVNPGSSSAAPKMGSTASNGAVSGTTSPAATSSATTARTDDSAAGVVGIVAAIAVAGVCAAGHALRRRRS